MSPAGPLPTYEELAALVVELRAELTATRAELVVARSEVAAAKARIADLEAGWARIRRIPRSRRRRTGWPSGRLRVHLAMTVRELLVRANATATHDRTEAVADLRVAAGALG
ncbi:hypothetical protein ABR737_40935 [Streptomyces sp. Edi2]